MDPTEGILCPDCNRLLTSDDWMEGDPPNLRIQRRLRPSTDKATANWCMLCSIIHRELNFGGAKMVEDHLKLGYRLQNIDDLEKKTSFELMCINKLRRDGDELEDSKVRPWPSEGSAAIPNLEGFAPLGQVTFSVLAENDGAVGDIICGRVAERDVASDRSMETIKRWIQHCDANHSSCPRPQKGKLPKRLIDISSIFTDGTVRLHATSNEQISYVCLSYCWGDYRPITTTSLNVESFSKSIPVPSLPQTIQDAIMVTSRLGFKYLWVDALCIIQDDSPEKAQEMADMANIYRHSSVTIIAAVGKDSNDGFLHRRIETPVQGVFTLPIPLLDQTVGRVKLCRAEEQIYGYPPEPISKRAWTLQESILSPRCLIFATQQVFWKCTRAFWKDGGFTDWWTFQENSGCWTNLGLAYTSQGLASFGGGDFVCVESALPPARSELARRWFKVAEAYSSRQLSVPEDKLPALSSIAAMYFNAFKDDYLAGLWRSSLLGGLLWVSNAQQENRPNRICPTWSWLSVDSSISFVYFIRPAAEWQSFTKIQNCMTMPLFDFAPYGQVKEGSFLEVTSPSFTMTLEQSPGQGTGRFALTSPKSSAHVLTSFFPDIKIDNYVGKRVECLVLFRTTWQQWTAAGLVLVACDLEKGFHERIGYFEAGPGSRPSWSETERKTLQASGWIFKAPRKTFTVV